MNATIITDNLAVGSFTAIDQMKKNGWVSICLSDRTTTTPDILIPMFDGSGNLSGKMKNAIDWILNAWHNNHKVYVCCEHGMNRSVSIAAASLTLAGKTEWFSNALLWIASKRNIASPRDDTMTEVLLLVNKLKNLKVNC
jgi:hypothetical protein